MSLNTEIPEIPIRRHTHWFVSIRVCRNIGVTGGITQLKIDEITNLGAVRIRLRSLFAALDLQ